MLIVVLQGSGEEKMLYGGPQVRTPGDALGAEALGLWYRWGLMYVGFVHADPIRALRAHPAHPCGTAEPSGVGDAEISGSQCISEEDAFVLVN